MEPLRLSPSRINDFNNCPALYKYRAILALPEPPSIEAERGKFIHSILEDLYRLSRSERTLDRALSALAPTWKSMSEDRAELAALVTDLDEWFDRAQSLLSVYFNLENPQNFDPTHLEFHVERDVRDGVYLHGYVDRLDIAPTGEVRIVDYKTGKSPRPGWEEKALFQLRVYALIYWKNTQVIPHQLKLIYLGNQQVLLSKPTETELLATERKIHAIADEILTSLETDFFPPKKSKLCDWCYFKAICPAHQKN